MQTGGEGDLTKCCPVCLLAVQAFSKVDEPRPFAFLDFMVHDPDPAVKALARSVRTQHLTRGRQTS